MSSEPYKNEMSALNAALDKYEAPLASEELQRTILADFDAVRPGHRRQIDWRELFSHFLAPTGAFSALSFAGIALGVASVSAPATAHEHEAFAYLSEAYETALLGAAADDEEVEIWQEF